MVSPLFAALVRNRLAVLADTAESVFGSLRYSASHSNAEQKEALSGFFSQHYKERFSADNLILTAGAQNAITSALLAVFSPGDHIACEEYTYRGLRYAAKLARIHLVPIKIDDKGMVPEHLASQAAALPIRGLVCVPNYQNPTARTMPQARRHAIAAIAAQHGMHVIEDDVYGLLAKNGIQPIYSLYPERTLLIHGFSKALGPGLRVGAIFSPPALQIPLCTAVRATTWMPSQIDLAIISSLITDGTIHKAIKDNRNQLDRRVNLFVRQFSKHESSFGAYCPHATIRLPAGQRAHRVMDWLMAERVFVESSEQFSARAQGGEFIRVNLTGIYREDSLAHALGKIATALEADSELL